MLKHEPAIDNTNVNVVVSRDGAVASLRGRIDIDSSPPVRDRLLALLNRSHPGAVIIDLSGVTHIDSSGIATLIEALRLARAHKTELRLQGLEDRLFRFFEITGILSLFDQSAPQVKESSAKVV